MKKLLRMAYKFIDIGANMTDDMYQGMYNGKKKHDADLDDVLNRSWKTGIEKIIITGTCLSDSKVALDLCNTNDRLFCTVGCHPTRCDEFENDGKDPDDYLNDLLSLVQDNQGKVVAIGECGLDYERTKFCTIDVQKKYFEKQISLAEVTGLPLFLHSRNSTLDLLKILTPRREKISGGVVHSFDGSKEDLDAILELDFFIGINGCSLKTVENLNVAKLVPSSRLLLETDCPWCEIRPTYAGFKYINTCYPSKKKEKWEKGIMVKSRNEPNCIVQVLEVLAAIRGEDIEELAQIIYANSEKLFFNKN